MNALSRSLEKALRAAGVPYQMVRGQEFYARKEIKDVLAYCQLVNNPRDDMAFERTVNTPPRGIGRKDDRAADGARVSLRDAAAGSGAARGGDRRLFARERRRRWRRMWTSSIGSRRSCMAIVEEVIGTVLEASGYRASLAESDDEQDQNRLANIEELLTDARQFDEQNPGGGKLEEYLERSWLVNETDNWDTETDKATLMTLHAAKGLEFPVVFIVAVEDGVLPHERVGQHPDELEEERRLAFVGHHAREGRIATKLRSDARLPRRAAADDSQLVSDGDAARRNGNARLGGCFRRDAAASILGMIPRRTRMTIRGIGRLRMWPLRASATSGSDGDEAGA